VTDSAPEVEMSHLLDLHQGYARRFRTCFENRNFIRSTSMMDVVMLAIGLASFALSIGYVYACDRL
jgi:hypothetical protein